MSNKTQIYCNFDNKYKVNLLKKLWKDLENSTKHLKEKESEVQELISKNKNYTAYQLIKIGRLRTQINHFKIVIKNLNNLINFFQTL